MSKKKTETTQHITSQYNMPLIEMRRKYSMALRLGIQKHFNGISILHEPEFPFCTSFLCYRTPYSKLNLKIIFENFEHQSSSLVSNLFCINSMEQAPS
jgi:hypothetical protein